MSDLPQILQALFALIFVLALMGGLALLLKRLGLSSSASFTTGKKRLKMVESMPLDARRRLVIVSCDGKEHLVILGGTTETVLDKNIQTNDSGHDEAPKQTH